MPPFEFMAAARIIDASKLFIRDLHQTWYQTGVPNACSNIFEIAGYIERVRDELSARDVTLVGNSMGGFVAIAMSALIPKCRTVAFSPQTFISPTARLLSRDWRWMQQVVITYLRSCCRSHLYDVLPLLRRRSGEINPIQIFAAENHRLDRLHAERLIGLPRLSVELVQGNSHNVVRILRDKGCLPSILAGEPGDR